MDGSCPLTEEDDRLISLLEGREGFVLLNKCDLGQIAEIQPAISTSAKTGEGLDNLRNRILEKIGPSESDTELITNTRHLHLLKKALFSVMEAEAEEELDCIATDLRDALHDLGMITGNDVDADIIDRIFERFCVGK